MTLPDLLSVTTSSTQLQFLLDIGIFAVAALVMSVAFARLKITIVSGQILAGMIVGPYVLGLVKDPVTINELSEIGIVLLLFIIGLELDPLELRRLANQVVLLTVIEVAISFAFGWLASYLLHFGFVQSVIFSMAASITSTAIVGKILLARRMLKAPEAGFLMGLMVCEDILAVVFLIILSSITSSNISSFPYFVVGQNASTRGLLAASEAILGGLALVGLGFVVARYVAPVIINHLSSYDPEFEEIPFLFALGLAFLFAIAAGYLGYSPGIGAFIIGLAIRGKHSRFLERKIVPIKDLFLVLFFVSVGSLIDPFPAFSLGIVIVLVFLLLVAGKFFGGEVAGRIFRARYFRAERKKSGRAGRTRTSGSFFEMPPTRTFGVRLVPRGEFSLLIGQLALTLGLVDQTFFSLVGMSVLVTAIVTSILQRFTEPRMASTDYLFKGESDEGI